jgi:molybdate transport system substrate-binding protein
MRRPWLAALSAVLLLSSVSVRAEEPVRVFAAASLTNALTGIAVRWRAAGHPAPVLAFGGSSTLAKQVEAGAPADLFASADKGWMDYLDRRGWVDRTSRVDVVGNELVLIAPKGRGFRFEMQPDFAFATAFFGKLCTGEPGVVPVGTYARTALQSLGAWDALRGRIVGTEDVRTALAFVERGECGAGIVYATDAAASSRVVVVARFPADSHPPIVYPFAVVKGARPEAYAFLDFLRNDPAASAVFDHYQFVRLQAGR